MFNKKIWNCNSSWIVWYSRICNDGAFAQNVTCKLCKSSVARTA